MWSPRKLRETLYAWWHLSWKRNGGIKEPRLETRYLSCHRADRKGDDGKQNASFGLKPFWTLSYWRRVLACTNHFISSCKHWLTDVKCWKTLKILFDFLTGRTNIWILPIRKSNKSHQGGEGMPNSIWWFGFVPAPRSLLSQKDANVLTKFWRGQKKKRGIQKGKKHHYWNNKSR